jgi:hypothetical protein
MKTIIMLSVIASLTAMITVVLRLDEVWFESQRHAANECQVNNYACFRPAVSFASLH